jgi:hypothetical protein
VAVRATIAFPPPGRIEPSAVQIPGQPRCETPTVTAVTAHLAGELAVGQSLTTVLPAPEDDDHVLVYALTRTG